MPRLPTPSPTTPLTLTTPPLLRQEGADSELLHTPAGQVFGSGDGQTPLTLAKTAASAFQGRGRWKGVGRERLLDAVGQVRELINAVIDALLVLVNVGPGVGGRADGGHPASGRPRDDRVRALDLRIDRLQPCCPQCFKHLS